MKHYRSTMTAALLAALAVFAGACASGGNGRDLGFDGEVDVLVIGAGAAGLTAAVEASDSGAKKVMILEKMGRMGGTSFTAQGMVAGYDSRITRAAGDTFTQEDLYKLVNDNAGYKLDADTIGITVRDSGRALEWLIDTVKVPFLEQAMVGYGPYKMMHLIGVMEDGTPRISAGYMSEPFAKALADRGIEVRLNTRAVALIENDRNAVIGVEAVSGGKTVRYKARSVIIATGGYAANNELAAAMDPLYKYIQNVALQSAGGDGLIMAVNAGAAISNPRALMTQCMDYDMVVSAGGNSTDSNDSPFIRNPAVIYVNPEGKRFMNEKDLGFMFQRLGEKLLPEMNKYESPFLWALIDQQAYTEGRVGTTGVGRTTKGLSYIQADTVEELAALMEAPQANLAETIRNYNAMARNGRDTDFNRDPPTMRPLSGKLYALKIVSTMSITYGGLIHNDKGAVMRLDGSAIPGLYCAGEVASNSAWMGFTLSSCFVWGRIAGQSAAEYIAKK